MSRYEDLIQAIRSWVILATGYDSDRVIPSYDFGTRPAIPYITVAITTYDLPKGQDESLIERDGSDVPYRTTYGDREATISIQGYGHASADAIELIASTYQDNDVGENLRDNGLVVIDAGSPRHLPVLVDSAFEDRFLIEPRVAYRTATTPVMMIPVEVIETTTELGSPDGDLTITVEHTL